MASKVPTGPMAIPAAPGFPWRWVVRLGLVLLVPVIAWVLMGMWPKARETAPVPHATVGRSPGRSLLDGVPKSAVGVALDEPLPPIQDLPVNGGSAPVDPSEKDRLIDQLTRDNQALTAKLRGQPTPVAPAPMRSVTDDAATRRADEVRKEAEEARKRIDVWSASAESRKGDVQAPKTPYSLPPTTTIPCTTMMQVTNQSSGTFLATVSEPVRTHRGTVVIPPGASLMMRPRGRGIMGDERMDVALEAIKFPDDRYVKVSGATVGDPSGSSGFRDQIDRRYAQLFMSIVLTGVLRSGSGLVGGYTGDTADRMAAGIAGETASQGSQQVRQTIRTEPIHTVRPLWSCLVILEEELVLTRAYEAQP